MTLSHRLFQLPESLHQLPEPFSFSTNVFLDPFASRMTCATGSHISWWDLDTRTCLGKRETKQRARKPIKGYFRDGMEVGLVLSRDRHTIDMLEPERFKKCGSLKGAHQHIVDIALSPCSNIVAAIDKGGFIVLWVVGESEPVERLEPTSGPFRGDDAFLRFSPDGRFLCVAHTRSREFLYLLDMAQREYKQLPFSCSEIHHASTPLLQFSEDSDSLFVHPRLVLHSWAATDSMSLSVDDLAHGTWQISLSDPNNASEKLDQPYEEVLDARYWLRGDNQRNSESGSWQLYRRGDSTMALPSSLEYGQISSDEKYLVLVSSTELYVSALDTLWDESPSSFRTSRLHEFAKFLSSGLYDVPDVIELLHEHELLLRWFAVDCAMYGVLKQQGKNEEMRASLKLCQKFALQSLSEDEHEAGLEKARVAAEFGKEEQLALYAVLAARRASNAVRGSRRAAPLEWRRARLAFLCEAWAICGDRTPWLLWEEQCPIEVPEAASFSWVAPEYR